MNKLILALLVLPFAGAMAQTCTTLTPSVCPQTGSPPLWTGCSSPPGAYGGCGTGVTLRSFVSGASTSLPAAGAPVLPQNRIFMTVQLGPAGEAFITADPHTCGGLAPTGSCTFNVIGTAPDSVAHPGSPVGILGALYWTHIPIQAGGMGITQIDVNPWEGPLMVSSQYLAGCATYGTCYTPTGFTGSSCPTTITVGPNSQASWYCRGLATYDALFAYAAQVGVIVNWAPEPTGDFLFTTQGGACGLTPGLGNYNEAQVQACTTPLEAAAAARWNINHFSVLHEPCGVMSLIFGTGGSCFLNVSDVSTLITASSTAVRATKLNSSMLVGAGAAIGDIGTLPYACPGGGSSNYWCNWTTSLTASLDYYSVHAYPTQTAALYTQITLATYGAMCAGVPSSRICLSDESSPLRYGSTSEGSTVLGCGWIDWLTDGTYNLWAEQVPANWAPKNGFTQWSEFDWFRFMYLSTNPNKTHCSQSADSFTADAMAALPNLTRVSGEGFIYGSLARGQAVTLGNRAALGGRAAAISIPPLPLFNPFVLVNNHFTPTATLGGAAWTSYPQMVINETVAGFTYTYNGDVKGWQYGVVTPAGQAVYFPYDTIPACGGCANYNDTVHASVSHGVMLSYTTASTVTGMNNKANWTWFDTMAGLTWYGKGGTPRCINSYSNPVAIGGYTACTPIVGSYVDGIQAGSTYYPVPGARSCPYCVLMAYNPTVGTISNTAAYQTLTLPSEGTAGALGKYGWTGGTFDGRYIYYAPLSNPADGVIGNILRYDTTGYTTNPATSTFPNCAAVGSGCSAVGMPNINAWGNFDMQANVCSACGGMFGVSYDGHQFMYFEPTQFSTVVRYNTLGPGLGSGPHPSDPFYNPANYTPLDLTTLGSPGAPAYSGQGLPASLAGAHGGGKILWDQAGLNQYLYLVPWSEAFTTGNPQLASTTVRVLIATGTGAGTGTWQCADFTATAPTSLCPSASALWEIYDLTILQANVAWGSWPKSFGGSSPYFGQPTISGWQLAWITSAGYLAYVANAGSFFVEHDPSHHLYDPAGWYVAERAAVDPTTGVSGAPNSAFGGPFDLVHGCGYPATPGTPLLGYCGFQ